MRFSFDAFVLNNKKDALYYSGPFSVSERTLVLNQGESLGLSLVNYTGTVTAAVTKGGSSSSAVTATVSGGAVTVAATANATAGDYVVTLTNGSGGATTTVNVKVV